MKRYYILIIILLFPFVVNAKEITKTSTIKLDGTTISSKVLDNNEKTYITIKKGQAVTIVNSDFISGLYIVYEVNGGKGTISNETLTTTFGENGFIHDYIDVKSTLGLSKTITLKFSSNTTLTDIHIIGEGDIPSFVELWNKPAEKADLLLFSTHSDDEQLFFSGLLPLYVSKGANVQVAYFTKHDNNITRYHEQLHGLYTVGIRNYPIFSEIPDAWSDTLSGAKSNLKKAHLKEEDAMKYMVSTIRRTKPLVIVGHDEKGEYGHGQHMLNTYILERAIDKANDETYDVTSYNNYGKWATKKVYIHLYPKNEIIMNYDEPLEYFNGKTAFQMSQKGFEKHVSQQRTWFRKWLYGENHEITKAAQITTYSPCEFGLFRSLVGPDKEKNDMFENLSFYKDISNEEELFNKVSEATIAEDPMEINDIDVKMLRIAAVVVIFLTGVGILYLIRKL